MGSFRQRGRSLSEVEIRRLRDLLYVLLVRLMGLSVDDAQAVFGSAVKERQIRYRLQKCPLSQGEVVRQMRSILAGGPIHGN